jgi:hypothetical protein
MELEVSWLDDSMEPISEWPEAEDMASTQCIATAGCAMCFIIFSPMLHLRCLTLLSIVLNAIPQIQVGAEMVTEVTSRLLHFLVGTALSTTAATVVYNTLSSMMCATPALLITFAPLISVMLASLVGIVPFALISGTVRLIVYIMALVKIRTSLLLGASLAITSGGGHRWSGCTPLVDLDCGCLQISLDSVKCRGFRELVEFVHGNNNIGARCLEHLLVVAHVKSIDQIMVDIALATSASISRIFFSILQVDSLSPTIGISFLPSNPLLIGLPVARGLVIANGEDGASEARWKG